MDSLAGLVKGLKDADSQSAADMSAEFREKEADADKQINDMIAKSEDGFKGTMSSARNAIIDAYLTPGWVGGWAWTGGGGSLLEITRTLGGPFSAVSKQIFATRGSYTRLIRFSAAPNSTFAVFRIIS